MYFQIKQFFFFYLSRKYNIWKRIKEHRVTFFLQCFRVNANKNKTNEVCIVLEDISLVHLYNLVLCFIDISTITFATIQCEPLKPTEQMEINFDFNNGFRALLCKAVHLLYYCPNANGVFPKGKITVTMPKTVDIFRSTERTK